MKHKGLGGIIFSALHLLFCICMSIDWPFIHSGGYVGFWPTFGLFYITTVPVMTGAFSLLCLLVSMIRKQTSRWLIFNGILGIVMLLMWLLPQMGIGSHLSFGGLVFLWMASAVIWVCYIVGTVKNPKK